jgi:hypothetical protein
MRNHIDADIDWGEGVAVDAAVNKFRAPFKSSVIANLYIFYYVAVSDDYVVADMAKFRSDALRVLFKQAVQLFS